MPGTKALCREAGKPAPRGRAPAAGRPDDELEQAAVALEDAREEAAAAGAEIRSLKAALAEAQTRLARREAAAEEARRGFEAAMAEAAASGRTEEGAAGEELQVALEELRTSSEQLEDSNAALARANDRLEAEVAARTAGLEAANAALADREERLRLIFEGATDYAIFALDLDGRVTDWNPGAERLLGFAAAEAVGRRLDAMWTPEDLMERRPEREMREAAERGSAEGDRWHLRKDGTRFFASGSMMPLVGADGRPRGFLKVLRDRTERRAAEERRRVLAGELDHRVKNTLAVVQAVAAQTLRHAGAPAGLQAALMARLGALARSHDLLTRNHWEGATLAEVVERTLAAHAAGGGRVAASGPPVRLEPRAAVTVNLAFHELATNAAKHGALSAPGGRVEVRWAIVHDGPRAPAVEVVWRERGGPPVRAPARRGFGSRLIERGLAGEFGAEAELDFAPEGVECRIRLPLAAGAVSE